jgi:predicted dehydrogenase
MVSSSVLLVGAGPMAVEYAKVLKSLGITPVVIGRGVKSANDFLVATDIPVFIEGLKAWITESSHQLPEYAIVAVGEKWVGSVSLELLRYGIKKLLIEKPGGFDVADIREVHKSALKNQANVYVGYNRRFYASVEEAKKIISADGGVSSFNFEFTEWSHVIGPIEKEDGVKEQWFLSNSTHVIDLAFHLGGRPKEMSSYFRGGLSWHPISSVFAGAGRSIRDTLFTYQANWESPGRWGLELLTPKHRLIFRPLEKLQVQKIGSVAIENVELNDSLDQEFKPGLYKQVTAFLANDSDVLPTIGDQVLMLDWYLRIRGDKK